MMNLPRAHARPRAFHIMAKPAGPACNLHCTYCFYIEKEKWYPQRHRFRMSDAVLESFTRQYIEAQQVPEITFAWQGGEPTLMGLDFFRHAVALQKQYCPPGKRITNSFQTNGTLLDDEWCEFLRVENFLVGISIDGPPDIHDKYRTDKQGRPSSENVLRGLHLMQKHGVEHNILCVVNRENSRRPLDVYRFLKGEGAQFIQFIPIVERLTGRDVSEATVIPEEYGSFLCAIYDEWVRQDVAKVYLQIVEVAFSVWLGRPAGLCVYEPTCGRGLALEHNGDLYSCDHYVFPEYHLGNITEQPLVDLVESDFQQKFGADKRDTLPRHCRECDVRFLCNGECPKNRFLQTPDGEEGLNYLCAGLKGFFHHIAPTMEWMAQAVQRGRAPASIMETFQAKAPQRPEAADPRAGAPGRNDPCPCGSGRKYKKCCGAR